jgi:hypothetical protein
MPRVSSRPDILLHSSPNLSNLEPEMKIRGPDVKDLDRTFPGSPDKPVDKVFSGEPSLRISSLLTLCRERMSG